MNTIYISGRVIEKESGLQTGDIPFSVAKIDNVSRLHGRIEHNKVRVSFTGVLATYLDNEIYVGDSVMVIGRVKMRTAKLSNGFVSLLEVRATHIMRMEQDDYE